MTQFIKLRQLPRALAATMLAMTVSGTGCYVPIAYPNILKNVNELETLVRTPPIAEENAKRGDAPEQAGEEADARYPFMEIPRLKARFCLERAIENYANSRASTGFDIAMLVVSGLAGGAGTAMGAAASAMDDTNPSRKTIGVASVTTLAAAGALLGLRTALNLHEVGRTQKVAAARDVNAAISAIEKYLLNDEPKDVGDDGFNTCRDEDINIANALPGGRATEPIEAVLAKAKDDAKDKKEAASDANKTKASADTAVEENEKKIKELEQSLAKAKQERGPASLEAKQTEKSLEAAKAAQPELKARAQEATEKAAIESLKAEVAIAQVDLAEKRVAALQAGGQLRRALFYLTRTDVRLSLKLSQLSWEAVSISRSAVWAAQRRVAKALESSAKPAPAPAPPPAPPPVRAPATTPAPQ